MQSRRLESRMEQGRQWKKEYSERKEGKADIKKYELDRSLFFNAQTIMTVIPGRKKEKVQIHTLKSSLLYHLFKLSY